MNLVAFCAHMAIDEAAARAALGSRHQDDAPWYMQVVLGLGAWVTAIAALFFVGLVMELVLDIDEPDTVIAVIGIALFAGAFWLLRRWADGPFTSHMAVAFAVAGMLLAVAGIAVPEESLWIAAVAALPFAAAAIWQQRSGLLQFLLVSIAILVWIGAVCDHWDRLVGDLSALTMPIGVALLLYPPRRDLRPTAFALLVVPLAVELVGGQFEPASILWYGWPAKILFLILFGALLAINLHRLTDARTRLTVLAGAIGVIAAALLLPTGASAALVLLMLAYCLGSRTLAALGTLAGVYFIWVFYYDLQSTLLTKSIILMSVGAVLLLCYGLLVIAARPGRST
ncbi:MAG TPA: DUF4401 domain-containing protein [Dongiaceae bacterium]|nr:DUF4401 domain-containing protein [Dongiaceae bacterium]